MTTEQLLTGWGRTVPTRASVLRLKDMDDLVAAMSSERPVIARGLGRAYGDAAQNAGGLVLDTRDLRRVTAFDREQGILTAQAGLDLGSLTGLVLPEGWAPPVLPGTRHVTLGGAVGCDIHGKNHHVDGSFARWVESLELVTPTGEVTELTRANGGDLWAATLGGLGLTGIVTKVRLRLARVPSPYLRVTTSRAVDLAGLLATMRERDSEARYSVAWVDCLKQGRGMGRGVLMHADHARPDEIPRERRKAPIRRDGAARVEVPDVFPSSALNAMTARAFNAVWYRKAPAEEQTSFVGFSEFFHPLDAVASWNRLYGRPGLIQYQAVVPLEAEDVLGEMLGRLSGEGIASFLGVLKRFGPGEPLLSFPIEGWTLALDLPAGARNLPRALDALDGLVTGCGGRVYLAKDSRLDPNRLEAMYPELPRWQAVQRQVDPYGRMRSDLSRRLGLVER